MGDTVSKEHLSSWSEPEVKKWTESARSMQQTIYLMFRGSQFHDITDMPYNLRITKLCYAIFANPSDDYGSLERAYSSDQRKFADKVYDKILEHWNESPEKRSSGKLQLGFTFVFCKEGEKEYQIPLFKLLWKKEGSTYTQHYIDVHLRTYTSPKDWKENNRLPMMKYCHPENLFYTCDSGWKHEFDPTKEVNLGFNTSPACDLSARLTRISDTSVTTVSMAVGAVSLYAMVWPVTFVGPVALWVAGSATGAYQAGRAANRLIDKGDHGESLSDLDSLELWATILCAPAGILHGAASNSMTAGAAAGRTYTKAQRVVAAVLRAISLSSSVAASAFGILNLVEKQLDGHLTSLDIRQFQVAALMFTNTFFHEKTVVRLVDQAVNQYYSFCSTNGDQLMDEAVSQAARFYQYGDQVEIVRGYTEL